MRLHILVSALVTSFVFNSLAHAEMLAGAAKIDITNRDVPVNDSMFARALVIRNQSTTIAIVAIDVVAIEEIGSIRAPFLANVRSALEKDLKIKPANVMINASHCHGIPCKDVEARTIEVVKQAFKNLAPVKIGIGIGHEDRIQENRRIKLKSGKEVDVRRAYSLPHDEEVASVGPIDPQIGILRLDRMDGRPLAVLYNFACHPIQGVPSGGNTADITGFSSAVIEENLDGGAIALFIQGCGGDINPVLYKHVDKIQDAEPLGNQLALSTLKAYRKIKTKPDNRLSLINEKLALPRSDLAQRIEEMKAERERLVGSIRGTFLNFETFLPLAVKYKLSGDFPSYHSHAYLHEKMLGRDHLSKMDAHNRANMKRYIQNILAMERLSRLNTNLALLTRHQARFLDEGRTIDTEVCGLRVGEFVLMTFPGELVVQIGLNIKKKSPHEPTFVAGYTNGYIYYSPTAEQLKNVGGAQEDSDCLLAPEWQELFESKVAEILKKL